MRGAVTARERNRYRDRWVLKKKTRERERLLKVRVNELCREKERAMGEREQRE